ncbi:hypothetical protein ACFL0V_01390 [Nanoarchaeota archaeon]
MRTIRPRKGHVLSTREAMVEVEGSGAEVDEASEGRAISIEVVGPDVVLEMPWKGDWYQVQWKGLIDQGFRGTQEQYESRLFMSKIPSLSLYTATILALDKLGDEGEVLASRLRDDFERGYMMTNTSVVGLTVCHDAKQYFPGGNLSGEEKRKAFTGLLVGYDDTVKVNQAYRRVLGPDPFVAATDSGPVLMGKGGSEDLEWLIITTKDEAAPARWVRYNKL